MADEEIVIGVKVETGEAAKSLKQLKAEYKEQMIALEGLRVGSKAYVDQLSKIGAIKEDISDLNTTIKAFNPEGKVKAFGTVLNGVASGFQAATGAAALFGNQSEDLQKALLKVQGAMAFTEGIKGVIALEDGFKDLKAVLLSNEIVLKAVGAAQKVWNFLMSISPIAAAVTVVAAFTAGIISLIKVLDKGATSAEKLKIQYDNLKESIEASNKVADSQIAILEAVGGKENDIYEIREKQLHQSIELSKLALQRATLEEAQAGQISITEKILLGSEGARAKADLRQIEAKKNIKKANDDLVISLNTLTALEEKESSRKEEQSNKNKKLQDDETKKLQEEIQKRIDAERQASINSYNAWADAENNKIDKSEQLKNKQQEEAKALEAKEFQEAQEQAEKLYDEYLAAQIAEADLERIKHGDSLAAQIEFEEKKRGIQLNSLTYTTAEKERIEAESAEKISQLKQKKIQEDTDNYQRYLEATQAITDIVFQHQINQAQGNAKKEREIRKRQFRVNKAFGIANSIIDGVQAVQKALNNPYPLNLVLAIASGILATANTVKIGATKFDDGGAGDSAAGGGAGASLSGIGAAANGANINAPSSGSTNLNADGTIKGSGVPAQKVYVVESDMTAKQKAVAKIEENSKI